MKRKSLVAFLLLCAFASAGGQEPVKATVCEIKRDPSAFNHKLVEVTGFVSHDFEDFTLFDPECPSWPAVWLEYGGKATSGTMYCCGVTADRYRSKELVVENVPVPLIVNQQFENFDKAIQPPFRYGQHGAILHATLVGRFFAGRRIEYFRGKPWGGYGHMGCCTLLAIQEIKAADIQNRTDLDYGASADQPDIDKVGCGYSELTPIERRSAWLQSQQQQADAGGREWAFEDPQRVAAEALTKTVNADEESLKTLKQIRDSQGRRVYEWKPAGGRKTYMVVVSRPYWLSYYARDPNRVAWILLAAYESSCGKQNSVTRIK